MALAGLIIEGVEAVGFLLAGIGALAVFRPLKRKVDEIHARVTQE